MKQHLLKTCLVMLLAVLGWGNAWANEVKFTFGNVASDLSWANGVAQTDVTLGNFTFTVSGGGNNGKYYTSDTTWRFYSGGALTITPASGYTITSVTTDPKQTFSVSEGIASTSFTATVKFKSITINYTTSGGGSTPEPTTYDVTVAENITGGTVSANPTSAAEGATVTLTATPATGYEFGAWDVKDANNNTITVTDNKFNMPAANVTVSATFNANATRPENEIFYESFDTNDGTGGNDDKWSGSIASNNISKDNEGWDFVKGNGANKCAKFGAGSSLGSATTPALGQACDATLTFKAAAWNGNSESTTLKLSVIGGGTISPATVTMKKSEWTTFTATLTSLTADSKVKFEGNSNSNSRFFLDEISVVKTGDATPVKTATSIAVKTTPTKVEYTEGDKFDPAGLVITVSYNFGEPEDIAYEGNESLFSFEPSLSTALTPENTSVTITYGEQTTTQTISVEAFSIANTQETAYTVAEAIALIDADKGLSTPVYVKGTVSKVVTAFDASYGNISVNISADGETTGSQFQLFRNFKGAEKEKWTSATEAPEVGDQVVAYGTLTKYNTTYEMAEGNYVVSIVKKNPIVKYNITIAENIENGSVTASAENAAEGDVITLTATPADGYVFGEWSVKGADNSTISVTDNKFTMPAADVTVSATFKAVTGGEPQPDDEAYILTDLHDIKAGDVVIITMTNSTGTYAISNANGTSSAPTAVLVTVSDSKITVDNSEILWNIDYNNGSFVAYVNGNNSKWLYCTNANNGVRVGTGDAKIFSINKGYMYEDGTSEARYIGVYNNADFRCYTSNGNNIANQTLAFYVKKSDTPASAEHTLTLVAQASNGDYYATFSADKDVIFLASQLAEVQTVFTDGDELLLETLSDESWAMVDGVAATESNGYYVPAGTGVLICSSEATMKYYDVTSYEYNQNTSDFSDNMLVAASVAMTGAYSFYKLAYDNYDAKTGLGFYWGAENGAAFTCKAGTAYLAVPTDIASNLRGFSFEGEGCITGIKAIATDKTNTTSIYNLQGQRVSRLQQGVNIVNGKKVIR